MRADGERLPTIREISRAAGQSRLEVTWLMELLLHAQPRTRVGCDDGEYTEFGTQPRPVCGQPAVVVLEYGSTLALCQEHARPVAGHHQHAGADGTYAVFHRDGHWIRARQWWGWAEVEAARTRD